MAKKKETEEKIAKCPHCKKKTVTFRMHECKRSVQEYYGCNTCDNWCIHCNENWADGESKSTKK